MAGWVRFRILGAIGGDCGATLFEVTAARQRALLAMLLLNANPTMSPFALDDALGCWTGSALAELADMPFADAMAQHLHELRFAIYELRNEAYLRCGRHVELLADIEPWVRQEPWRERLRAQQMVSLYRSGRQVA